MAKESILRMVCDRCGSEEILNDKADDRDAVRSRMGRWQSLQQEHMGGEDEWLLCPECYPSFHIWLKGKEMIAPVNGV